MNIANSADILQAVIEATPDAIFVKDLEGRYVLVNDAAARFLGLPPAEIIGKHDLELYEEQTARQFIKDDELVLSTGHAQSFEGVAAGKDSSQAYLVTKGVYRNAEGRILGLYGISHDVTELRIAHETLERTREALFRSQKLEAVGQLTGGIAHDFNNILSVIYGNVELLRRYLPRDGYADELIDTISRATHHGQELTTQLLSFARGRQLNPQPVGINAMVEDMVRLLGRTLGATIRIVTATSPDAGVAMADTAALETAVLNVALNARDAMPDGGTLTIRTSRLEVTASPASDADLRPGVYGVIALEDTGLGMSPDVIGRVFEPFFTTKGTSGGTGLGLSMVYGFARQSGGTVTIESHVGTGTTVSIVLPLTTSQPVTADADVPAVSKSGISRTVLLVEDEPAVRSTVRRQLESLGHRVLVAEGAAEAVLLLKAPDPGAPDLLLTDIVLGYGANGIDLALAARESRPDLPLIFMSGYAAVRDAQHRVRTLDAPLLTKPLTLSQIERAVNQVCGVGRRQPGDG